MKQPHILVLAGSSKEGGEYARRAALPRAGYRIVQKASSIKGLRYADAHILPGFRKRLDRHAILAELKYIKGNHVDVEMPTQVAMGQALREAYDLHEIFCAPSAEEQVELERAGIQAAITEMEAALAALDLVPSEDPAIESLESDYDAVPPSTPEEPNGQPTGETEQSEDAAPDEGKGRSRRSRCRVCGELTLGDDDPAHLAEIHANNGIFE